MNKNIVFFSLFVFINSTFVYHTFAQEPLTWQDCVKEAAKNHPDLISAQEVIKQSEAGKKITASGLFPQIDSNLSASTAKTTTGSGSSTVSKTTDSYSYGLTGSQLLFDGLKTINDVNAAGQTLKAQEQAYRFTSTQVRLRLKTAFVNLLRAQDLIQVAEEIVRIRRDNLELITLRYASGLEHRGALLTAEANLAEADFGVAQAKRDVELAQRQLIKEMGRKDFTPLYVKGDFNVSDSAKERPDLEALAKNHPSLQQAAAKKNSAQFQLKSSYANFSPALSANAGADKSSSHWPPRNDQWNLGLSVTMPVFEGGLRFAQIAQAKALLNQLQADERSTHDGIIVNLEQTWTALQDAIDSVNVQYKALIAAQERSKIAQAQYSVGFINYDNWTIIEDNLVSAKRDFLNAQANALFAEANWIQAKGETLEYAQ